MGTVTFLSAVNASLRRVRVIQGDAGALATSSVTSTATGLTATEAFTDSSRQNEIDIMLQCWNEAIHEVFTLGMISPEVSTATISLVTAQREYTLPSDMEKIAGSEYGYRVFRGATRQHNIAEYPGGYAAMLADQSGLASQWTGEPNYYALSPASVQTVRFDTEPTANENGWRYNLLYEKRFTRSSTMATETLPFSDTVTDALVPVVASTWQLVFKKEPLDSMIFRSSVTRALEHAVQTQRGSGWTLGRR